MLLWWSISKEYKWNIESINSYLNELMYTNTPQNKIVITYNNLTSDLATPL